MAFGIDRLTKLVQTMAVRLDAAIAALSQEFAGFAAHLASVDGKVDKLMATLQDLDDSLTAFETAADAADQADAAAEAETQAAVNDILARVSPTVDVSAEVARIQAAQAKRAAASAALKSAADGIKALDVQPQPAPTPDPTPARPR